MNTACVEWSLEIKCPYCNTEFDLSDDDSDGVYANAIFNNNWDSLHGNGVSCIECGREFAIDSVEY